MKQQLAWLVSSIAMIAAVVGFTPSVANAGDLVASEASISIFSVDGYEPDAADNDVAAAAFALAQLEAPVANASVPGRMTATYVSPDMPAEVIAVFDAAIAEWSSALELSAGAPVEIQVSWRELGPGILGSAGAYRNYSGGGLPSGASFPAPLANVLTNSDLSPGAPEILVTFNSGFSNWHLGTSAAPFSSYDLLTVALHEIGHGLGFAGGLSPSGLPSIPTSYDLAVYQGNTRLVDLPNPGAAVTSNNLDFITESGRRMKLYTPATYQPGSSYSHFDEATYPPGSLAALMTPSISNGEMARKATEPVLAVLQKVGWTLTEPGGPGAVPAPTVENTFSDETRLVLKMTSGNPGETGTGRFEIRRNGTVVETVPYYKSFSAWHTSLDLPSNAAFEFSVVAINASGERSAATKISARTDAGAPAGPAAPTGLKSTRLEPRVIVLNWLRLPQVGRYEVLRDGVVIGTSTDGWFVDQGSAEPKQTYSYTVRGITNNATGSQSGPLVVKTPATKADMSLRSTLQTRERIVLNWREVAGAASYVIERNDGRGNSWFFYVIGNPNDVFNVPEWFTNERLSSNTSYTYTVRAYVNEDELLAVSAPLRVSTK